MKRSLYDHGLPFSAKLKENTDDVKARVERRKAGLIIVDGGVGEGKTTLAVEIADDITGRPIVFEEQLAMGGADFLKKLRICYDKKLPVIIYDESGDFNKRGALTRFNAMLNRTFETFRAFKIIVILVLPSFSVLDQDIFDKNIPRLLLNCHSRTTSQGNFRGYSLSRMLYIRDRMKKLPVKAFAYANEQPNFVGHFLDLPEKRSAELDRFSIKGKLGELRKAEVKIEGLVTMQEMAQKVVRSLIWVRVTLKELGIKPRRILDKRHYYDGEVIDRLADYIDDASEKKDTKEGKR